MTRKKVKLAYITNESARKATFKKRKKGLMKKVHELSTLCGIDACAIVYGPYDSHPEVWPSPLGVQRVLSKFRTMPEMEQSKKMVNQETFLKQRITKAHEQLKKQRRDNREKEVTHVMFQSLTGNTNLGSLNMIDLNDLGWMIDHHVKDIDKRVETLNPKTSTTISPPPPLATAAAGPSIIAPSASTIDQQLAISQNNNRNNNNVIMNTSNLEVMEAMQRQQWFMDLMKHQENIIGNFGGDDISMLAPYNNNNNNTNNGDMINTNNQNAFWSNGLFP